jgi:hypothetical protein
VPREPCGTNVDPPSLGHLGQRMLASACPWRLPRSCS